MSRIMYPTFCICTLFVADVIGVIIQRPLNVATNVGGETVFNCSTDTANPLTWLYTANCDIATGTPLTENNCNVNNNHTSNYRTEKPGGNVCNLIVFSAMLSHGGCYTCTDGFGTGSIYYAILIIVDSTANIGSNSTDIIRGQNVMISSSISYGGPSLQPPSLPPSFYWTLQSDPNQNITSYSGSTTTTIASSYIVVTAQPPTVPPYLCNLFFKPPVNVPSTCAVNAPTYRTTYATPTYNVLYPPQDLNVSGDPIPCLYETGVLTCSASGDPPPTYQWFNFTSGQILSTSNTVTVERRGPYQCVASNMIISTTYNASTVADVYDCQPPQNVNISAADGPCASNADSCKELSSDTLTCQASAFPEPEFEWSFDGGSHIGPTAVAKENIVYKCTATNQYGGQQHSGSATLNVFWLTLLMCVNLGISDSACISLIVLVTFFGLNLLSFAAFMIYYACSESGRNKLNELFPWLKKMLPCMNGEGCICSVWIFLFVILSIFTAIVFFPVIVIMANCCHKNKKASQVFPSPPPTTPKPDIVMSIDPPIENARKQSTKRKKRKRRSKHTVVGDNSLTDVIEKPPIERTPTDPTTSVGYIRQLPPGPKKQRLSPIKHPSTFTSPLGENRPLPRKQ